MIHVWSMHTACSSALGASIFDIGLTNSASHEDVIKLNVKLHASFDSSEAENLSRSLSLFRHHSGTVGQVVA